MSDRVRLEGITSGEDVLRKPAWLVTLAFYPSEAFTSPVSTATIAIPKAEYDEEHVVKIARNLFHQLARQLAAETSAWALGADEAAALKRDVAQSSP